LLLLSLIGAVLAGLPFWITVAGLGLLGTWTAMGLLFFNRPLLLRLPLPERFATKIQKLFEPFSALRKKPFRFVVVSAISLTSWMLALGLVGSMLWILDARVGAFEIIALWPLAIFVGMLPLTMAGMGTRDAAFIGLLAASGAALAEANILAATFGYALVGTWLPALVGLPFMLKSMARLPEPITNSNKKSTS
ncbi:MAG: lysylphosphatidylglycerol synthase domain-containing protein, partial [Bradymonadaceae bacterium]